MPEETFAAKPPDARKCAAYVLHAILDKKQALEEAWDAAHDLRKLEPRDQSLCRLLVLTILRQLGFIDHTLDRFLQKRAQLTPMVQQALRIGVAQLLFLKTPAHAAVNTSLEMLDKEKKSMKGVVNAVLRKIAALPAVELPAQNWQLAVPSWLLESWQKLYGAQITEAIAKAALTEAPLDITVRSPEWAEKLGGTVLPNGSVRVTDAHDITQMPGFIEGAWWVQDAAATLPVMLAGDVKDKLVFDVCAAPGGKAMQLAAKGARVIAADRSEKRLQRLKENAARMKFDLETKVADAAEFSHTEKANIVLLDAPCSATGTIRRHPDLMHTKSMADVTRLAAMQAKLLAHAKNLVDMGGLVIYAVCSLQHEEGPDVVNAFLAKNPDWVRVPVKDSELGGTACAELIDTAGDLRTLPCHWGALGGMDGFYAARLKRVR